jgi:uncharacterized protein (TIGR02246 family)
MFRSNRVVLFAVTVVLILAACAQQPPPAPPDTRAADEAAIRSLVKQWSDSAATKDPAKFAAFYADDALFLFENMPLVSGKAAIAEALGPMMQDPNFALTFGPTKVDVARSGDIAYETGTYQLTLTDQKTKKPFPTKGKYIVVWKKVGDTWKVAVDAPLADPPEPPAAKK